MARYIKVLKADAKDNTIARELIVIGFILAALVAVILVGVHVYAPEFTVTNFWVWALPATVIGTGIAHLFARPAVLIRYNQR